MAIAIDPKALIPYVLPSDRSFPPDQQTRFLLRPMTRRTMLKHAQRLRGKDENTEEALDQGIAVIEDHLGGWENFNNANGVPVEFNPRDPAANIDMLALGTVRELIEGIQEISGLKESELKN